MIEKRLSQKDVRILDLQHQIEKVKEEILSTQHAVRMVRKVGIRGNEYLVRPNFICDECGATYEESFLRIYKKDETWPELIVCPYCNKLLDKCSHVPRLYKRWFPGRFDINGRYIEE